VLLCGEPGIGKSRLAAAVSEIAQSRGFRSAWFEPALGEEQAKLRRRSWHHAIARSRFRPSNHE
jgi:predicted ATP-dependent serine protease